MIFKKLFSDNVRWLIQVPRLFDIYRINNCVENFQVSEPIGKTALEDGQIKFKRLDLPNQMDS